jgi:hypothetical protein
MLKTPIYADVHRNFAGNDPCLEPYKLRHMTHNPCLRRCWDLESALALEALPLGLEVSGSEVSGSMLAKAQAAEAGSGLLALLLAGQFGWRLLGRPRLGLLLPLELRMQ